MKIKVCGITQASQLKALDDLGVDYVGMIFYSRSPRYMLNKLTSDTLQSLQLAIKKVGIFVNASEEDILTQVELYGLDIVQLHGDETPSFCNHISDHVKVIKAFRINIKNEQNIDWMIKPYEDFCDFYLFDTGGTGNYGGSGEKFSWEVLKNNTINKPFFLSGGIGLEDIDAIKSFTHPFLYAIDINSKVEIEPGVKNLDKVKQFINQIKQ